MKKLLVLSCLFLFSIGQSYSGSQSIISTCFFSCKTTVKINGVKRVYEGIGSAKVLGNTSYIILDETKVVNWPDGEIKDISTLEADCPSCFLAYMKEKNVNPGIREFCDDNYYGSNEGACEEILEGVVNLEEAQMVVDACDDTYSFSSEKNSCFEAVYNGELNMDKLLSCSESNSFRSEKKECLQK